MLGLSKEDLDYIIKCIVKFSVIEKAVVFGSRAKGNYKKGSDIDIAIWGENITFTIISDLHSMLEDEGPMPYMIDVVNYNNLSNQELKSHIERVGIVIYSKQSDSV